MAFLRSALLLRNLLALLSGLNLNPEAVHVWNYLRTALSLNDRCVCMTLHLNFIITWFHVLM